MPGKISVWRARWVLMRYGRPPEPPPQGVVVTGHLLALVTEVAARVGVAAPDAVVLTGHGVVRSWASRRRRLLIVGLPLLYCLTVDEIRALVAHELAVVDHRRAHLVARLRDLYEEAADPSRVELPPRAAAVLRATREFATALERKADQAASSASGLHTAARAVVKADLAEFEFADLAFDLEEQVWQHASAAIQDVHDGWRAAIRAGAVRASLDEDTRTTLMSRHPNLAGAIAPLAAGHFALRAADLVPVDPLTAADERTLARHVLRRSPAEWTTFAAVPATAWPGWVVRQARAVHDQVATLLGREPVGPGEVVEVLLTRLDELVAANWPAHPEPPTEPEDLDATPSVVVVMEAALTSRGWRRVHPATPGVLVSESGVGCDLHGVATSPTALADLRALLESPV
ncbi:hypothetical protein GCM10010532_055390 [Dactylosporangium siamense]|uniref:Uncharacterized protein n=1 Tax=Dactylosporangium siamense TaxID=685454 RepID=A0A919PP62_9ACTN|nr:hypothetical protein Dsi01nite_040060 [Dactylosporangium siamense]